MSVFATTAFAAFCAALSAVAGLMALSFIYTLTIWCILIVRWIMSKDD